MYIGLCDTTDFCSTPKRLTAVQKRYASDAAQHSTAHSTSTRRGVDEGFTALTVAAVPASAAPAYRPTQLGTAAEPLSGDITGCANQIEAGMGSADLVGVGSARAASEG